ncbi:hypothetical protein EBZ37_15465, partial [bacterium]|nr:hypothetical protein [bacterium]
TSVSSALIGLAVLGHGLAGFSSESLVDRLPWVGSYAISYELAIDGISRVGVLIISILFPVLIASEWTRRSGARGMYALFLVLQGSLLGSACAQDLFLLFFFWSISSIPIFFLVGIWGGENKEAAAFRALVTSVLGNALLFGAFVLIYYSKEPHTFLIRELLQSPVPEKLIRVAGLELPVSKVAFVFVFLATALRAPVWPVHGWFTRLMVEAPASVVVAVAAAVVPSAVLIFARLGHELFPGVLVSSANWILAAGLINMLAGTFVVSAEKRLSSILSWIVVVQVGFSLIAIGSKNSSSMVGLVYQQLSLALAVAGLGLVFGAIGSRGFSLEGKSGGDGSE